MTRPENKFINVSVERMIRQTGDFLDAVPIIVSFLAHDSVCLFVLVDVAKNPGSAGVNPVRGSLWRVAFQNPSVDGLRGGEIVCGIGGVCVH